MDRSRDPTHGHDHGMSDAGMKAMFAKQGKAIGTKGATGVGAPKRPERANLPALMNSKKPSAPPAKPVKTKASKPAVAHAPAAKASHAPPAKAGGHEKGHSPLQKLKHVASHVGHTVKKTVGHVAEGAHKTVEGAVAASGQESTVGGMKASMKGHKFGAPDDGRHEDR